MSYIFDALKKSQQQRGEQRLPEAAIPSPHPPAAAGRRRIAGLMLLAASLLAAGWLIARLQPAPNTRTEHPVTPVTTAQQPLNTQQQNSAPRVPSEPMTAAAPQQKPQRSRMPASKPAAQATAPRRHSTSPPTPMPLTTETTPAQLTPTQSYPIQPSTISYDALPVALQQSLPPIRIEGHIYDASPAARMVIINGVIRREHQMLGPELKLEEITSDGIVLSYRHRRFHMGIFNR